MSQRPPRLTPCSPPRSLSTIHSVIKERAMNMEDNNRARIAHRAVKWLTLVILAGCAPTNVDTVQQYSGKSPLPRPDRVLVYDFAVSANDVKLNSAIGARLANLVT